MKQPKPRPAVIPVSVVIPTRDRAAALARTLQSLAGQGALPAELVVIDASAGSESQSVAGQFARETAARGCEVIWRKAAEVGAAVQRNQGVALARQSTIAFFDDDILFEADCVALLWDALANDPALGGVNAMIVNQRYQPPGRVSAWLFRVLAGRHEASYAGRVLGPAINLLPEDRPDLPEVVPVEWLNTTCALYRREALADPPFGAFFKGYSLMEDLALSLTVGRRWKLANARTARIYHDSQTGDHKSNVSVVSRMEFNNRHYIMTEILGRKSAGDYAKLALWEIFQLVSCAARHSFGREFRSMAFGKLQAARDILGPSLQGSAH